MSGLTHLQVRFGRRNLTLTIEPRAFATLQRRSRPLTMELELYFGCLIRKRVRFLEDQCRGVEAVPGLWLDFHPVMTRGCSVAEGGKSPPLTDFPLARREAFAPRWARLGQAPDGTWRGTFGW